MQEYLVLLIQNAKIISIDDTKARKLKGVIDIIHKNNTKAISWYGENGNLFDENVKHEGDEVACVVAETEAIAKTALELIQVQYEELGFSVTTKESLGENSYKIYDLGNIRKGKPG
jgi:CO/xanthine dehydrogenase Mo-binding subunit